MFFYVNALACAQSRQYMTDVPASKVLTNSLKTIIRQQRHFGIRVVISSQEPTISASLIDLCSITIMHRFTSPEWLTILEQHISLTGENDHRSDKKKLLQDIMSLKKGEALVFAPSAFIGLNDVTARRRSGTNSLLRIRTRKRMTWDGGRTLTCIEVLTILQNFKLL